jgi:hypothetical protein
MVPTHAPFTRLLAALTPVLLLWGFVGCVVVCAEHAEERLNEEVTATSVEVSESHCSEPCPVTEASFLVPAKRFAPGQHAVGTQYAPLPTLQEPPRALPFSKHHPQALKPPGPPFESLRTLRI